MRPKTQSRVTKSHAGMTVHEVRLVVVIRRTCSRLALEPLTVPAPSQTYTNPFQSGSICQIAALVSLDSFSFAHNCGAHLQVTTTHKHHTSVRNEIANGTGYEGLGSKESGRCCRSGADMQHALSSA